ncbi:helix-turn-helix domain-containing protein [Rhodobacter lacus]|uniref:Helix-turn-helix domain-containing protein n=1 Tax=Rhodobacter lacus TaxID=1641972 RepID=A0ABW5AE46_9RHOB
MARERKGHVSNGAGADAQQASVISVPCVPPDEQNEDRATTKTEWKERKAEELQWHMTQASPQFSEVEMDVGAASTLSRIEGGLGAASRGNAIKPFLMTSSQAANFLAISERSLRRLRSTGLKYVVLGAGTIRYRRVDLESYIGESTCHFAPRTRATGTMISKFGVVDFMEVVKPKTTRRPRQ